jgi:FAD/FMN-containing dehydrogenase
MSEKSGPDEQTDEVDRSRRKFIAKVPGLVVTGILGSTGSITVNAQGRDLSTMTSLETVSRDDANYESRRSGLIWQAAKPDRQPELIMQAKSVDDVIAAVNYARIHGKKLIAKSGGHSISASFMREEGVLLNMLRMQAVEVNPETQTVSAEPGTWGPSLLNALEPQGLGFPVARGGSVSIGGFLLGGGLGFNPNTWRIACFSILAADVVLADGSFVHVNENKHADIYWAVRGAGPGFFGVVTKFYLQVYPQPGSLLTSQYIHPLSEHKKISRALEKLVVESDHKLELILLLTSNPDKEAVAAGGPKQVCLINVNAYGESQADARALLLTVANSALADRVLAKNEYEVTSLRIMTGETSSSFPRGRMATEGVWSNSIRPVISALIERMEKAVTPITTISIRFMSNTSLPADAAFSLIGSTNILSVLTWDDEADDEKVNGWLRETMHTLEPYSLGHYINNEDVVSYPERNRNSFSKESWGKLRALRKQYDPDNVFHDYFGMSS